MAIEDFFYEPAAGGGARPINWNKAGKNILLATFLGVTIEAANRQWQLGLPSISENLENNPWEYAGIMADALTKGVLAYAVVNNGIHYINVGRENVAKWLQKD